MTCLRLKRYLSEDCSDAIIVSFKRPRMCQEGLSTEEDEVKSVLKFAGTVKTKDESVAGHLTKVANDSSAISNSAPFDSSSRRNLKYRSVNVKSKVVREHKLTSQANRYKIVSCARGVHESDSLAKGDCAEAKLDDVTGSCQVYDVEQVPESSPMTGDRKKAPVEKPGKSSEGASARATGAKPLNEENYVYDLYYLKDMAGVDLTQKLINIQPYTPSAETLVHNFSSDDSDQDPDDEDDSNDEDNWRNDYPDEDDNYEKDYAFGEDEFCDGISAMGAFNIDEDSYCYGEEEEEESDDEDSPMKFLPMAKGKMSLRAQMMKIAKSDNIFTNAKSGNHFK